MNDNEETPGNKHLGIYEEFSALRQEILHWQKFRFDLLKGYLALSGVLIAAVFALDSPFPWQVLPIIQSLLAVSLMNIFQYADNGNAKMGAYIQVFLEEIEGAGLGWQKRLKDYQEPGDIATGKLNMKIAIVLLATPFVSGTLVWFIKKDFGDNTFTIFAGLVFGAAIYFVLTKAKAFQSNSENKHVAAWNELKDKLNGKKQTPQEQSATDSRTS